MKKLVVPLTLGLFTGSAVFAQLQKADTSFTGGQTTPQDTVGVKDADRATTDTNHEQTPGREGKKTTNDEFTRTGMYDEYKTHWNARFHDDEFAKYQEEHMKLVAPNSAPNRQGTTNYQQFSEDTTAWSNRVRAGQAWRMSDAYWRTSDRYWRSPDRRKLDTSGDYWKKSDAYWRDSEKYRDTYDRDGDQDESNSGQEERVSTNK